MGTVTVTFYLAGDHQWGRAKASFIDATQSVHKRAKRAKRASKSPVRKHRVDFTSFSHFKMQADANESDQNEVGYFVVTYKAAGGDARRSRGKFAVILVRQPNGGWLLHVDSYSNVPEP